jgi:hypothetical protein
MHSYGVNRQQPAHATAYRVDKKPGSVQLSGGEVQRNNTVAASWSRPFLCRSTCAERKQQGERDPKPPISRLDMASLPFKCSPNFGVVSVSMSTSQLTQEDTQAAGGRASGVFPILEVADPYFVRLIRRAAGAAASLFPLDKT